jgi:imidazolonepropionase-like amidohydrolase
MLLAGLLLTSWLAVCAAEPPAQPPSLLALRGGRVVTGSGEVYAPGIIIVRNGRIEAVGDPLAISIPDGATQVDLSDRWLCPGFVSAMPCKVALAGKGRWNERYNRFDPELELLLAVGITAFYVSEGMSSNRIAANNAVLRAVRDGTDSVVVAEGVAAELDYSAAKPSRRGELDQVFDQAQTYREQLERHRAALLRWKQDLNAWQQREEARHRAASAPAAGVQPPASATPADPRPAAPEEPKANDAVKLTARVLAGELPLRVRAERQLDLEHLVALCRRYRFRELIIEGAAEGWTKPALLAEIGARVIVNPLNRLEPKFADDPASGWTIENAARLRSVGIELAVAPGSLAFDYGGLTGDDLLTFRMAAAFAVRGGLSDDDALRAITAGAAAMLGQSDRLGVLAPGRHADILVLDGDPLHYRTLVEQVYIGGRLDYERTRSTWFAHIQGR